MHRARLGWYVAWTLCAALGLAPTPRASAQACPAGRACFYVPPAMPAPIATTVGWDMVLSSPRGTITGTWRAGTGSATAFSVSPGSPAIISLSATAGTASDFGVVETRGIFIDASSQELIVDHRESSGLNQSSSTIKSSAYGLGTRFRLGGYNLNGGADGFDYASVYAPFGASVTFEAPVGATLPFWEDSATTTLSVTLAAGETYIARTLPAPICTREIDGALVTSSDPITVDTGGRGNSLLCGLSGTCGDDGADGVLPVSGLGTEYVVVDFPSSAAAGEDVLVVADTANTEVRVNGALVATLGVGGTFVFTLTGAATYVETSHPAYVYQNTGMAGCELDIALIPPVVLAPVGSWSVDFNVRAGSRRRSAS